MTFLKGLFITQAAAKQNKMSQAEIDAILKEVGSDSDEDLNEILPKIESNSSSSEEDWNNDYDYD